MSLLSSISAYNIHSDSYYFLQVICSIGFETDNE